MNTLIRTLTAALMLMTGSLHSAHAARDYLSPTPPPYAIEDRFRLEVGVLQTNYETTIRLDRTPQTPGTQISAEEDLGLDDSDILLQLELTLLPGEHHMVRLHGMSMRRDGSKVINRRIEWDNNVYNVGERVDSIINISMIGLTYGWLPLRTDRYDLGISAGVQIADVEVNAEVRSRFNGLHPREEGIAPVPHVGLEGRFDFTRRWSVDARYQYLSISKDDIDAKITDARFALRWRQNQHLVIGLGYRMFDLTIESADEDTPGFVSLKMNGPMLFVQGSM